MGEVPYLRDAIWFDGEIYIFKDAFLSSILPPDGFVKIQNLINYPGSPTAGRWIPSPVKTNSGSENKQQTNMI